MKFAQMCELPTDSAVTQTASSGDENQRGTGAEKRRPLSKKKKKKERGEGGWNRGVVCSQRAGSLARLSGRQHYIK